MPARPPIQNEPNGPTKPEAGVMATSPATAPEQMPITVGLPFMIHSTTIQAKPALLGPPLGHAGGWGRVGCTDHHLARLRPRAPGRAGVEAEPADPQQRGAD